VPETASRASAGNSDDKQNSTEVHDDVDSFAGSIMAMMRGNSGMAHGFGSRIFNPGRDLINLPGRISDAEQVEQAGKKAVKVLGSTVKFLIALLVGSIVVAAIVLCVLGTCFLANRQADVDEASWPTATEESSSRAGGRNARADCPAPIPFRGTSHRLCDAAEAPASSKSQERVDDTRSTARQDSDVLNEPAPQEARVTSSDQAMRQKMEQRRTRIEGGTRASVQPPVNGEVDGG
jgi:hypothetical protein